MVTNRYDEHTADYVQDYIKIKNLVRPMATAIFCMLESAWESGLASDILALVLLLIREMVQFVLNSLS